MAVHEIVTQLSHTSPCSERSVTPSIGQVLATMLQPMLQQLKKDEKEEEEKEHKKDPLTMSNTDGVNTDETKGKGNPRSWHKFWPQWRPAIAQHALCKWTSR